MPLLTRSVSSDADANTRRVALFALVLFALLCASRSRAQAEAPLTLHWVRGEGAESCLSGKELNAQLDEALAAQRVSPAALTIEGLVQRDANNGPWRARLRVLDSAEVTVGTRELTSVDSSCDSLSPSIVLVLALLVELGSGGRVAPPAPATTPAVDVPCAPSSTSHITQPIAPMPDPTPAKPGPATAKDEAARWQAEPIAALTLALGLLPGAALGPQLGLRVRSPWPVSLLVQGGYWPAASKSIDTPPGAVAATLRMSAYHGDVSLCLGMRRPASWWLAGCWGVAAGARRATTSGLEDAEASRRAYVAASAMAQFGYAVSSRLSLALLTSFLGFTREDIYSYEDARGMRHEVFRAGRFAGLLALGLGVRL